MNKYFFSGLFLFCLFSCKSDQSTTATNAKDGFSKKSKEEMHSDNPDLRHKNEPNGNSHDHQHKHDGGHQHHSNGAISTSKTEYKTTIDKTATNGVKYTIFSSGEKGQKARLQDYLRVHLTYSTIEDSLIYSSYKLKVPLHFKFSETLFRGTLTEGITQMQAGDSATFVVPAAMMYPTEFPSFLKEGENLRYHIKLLEVEDPSSREK